MAAINDTPQATELVSATQAGIRANFASIDTAFNLNHGNFGTAEEGKHNFLQMPEQGAAPTTLANEAGLYAAAGTTSTVSELVFRRENNGPEIAFTEGSLASPGWCRLPSGLILKWGVVTSSGAVAYNVAQTHAYGIGPAFTTVYSVQVSVVPLGTSDANLNTFVQPYDWTTNVAQFTYYAGERTSSSTRQAGFTYLALGS